MKIFTSNIPMEQLRAPIKLSPKYLKYVALSLMLMLSWCDNNKKDRGENKIAEIAPEHNDWWTMIDAGDGSTTIEYKVEAEIPQDTIPTDTTNTITETDTLSADTTINQPYSPFENIINDPTTPDQIEQNIEYMEVQIKRSTDPKSLMLIAASEHCNTYLIVNIAKRLQWLWDLTSARAKRIKILFKEKLNKENENNEFNKELDEILNQGKLDEINEILSTKIASN